MHSTSWRTLIAIMLAILVLLTVRLAWSDELPPIVKAKLEAEAKRYEIEAKPNETTDQMTARWLTAFCRTISDCEVDYEGVPIGFSRDGGS